ncbi:hypothetical protein EJV47_15120 [Hymenobacter gummosus]|uniref:Prolyl 4-hydroxylase alpha subunit domain-containing protein n=1 Tax=Hymenobacter gummosus TaxID=1776032 RepID=A0A431U1F6_9BACT|nr:2OG-Fe(II) oxygenase [Hymenobacter gummosus]RTQ48922.1 hypothetical protein EJV47_15120 [Hymenobacter gummosus]
MSTESAYDLLPDSALLCRVIPRLFSPAECAALLAEPQRRAFASSAANYPTYYRNNERCVVDDAALAARLLARAAPYLPATLPATDAPATADWELLGVNSRIRFCRYAAGQYFHRHLDGVHHVSPTVQSRLTFMVYLNDARTFGGGRTLFFRDQYTPEIWAAYHPQQGDLIVFDHQIWHEGEELSAGEKFVLRSDLLYQQPAPAAAPGFAAVHLGYIWQLCPLGPLLLSAGRDQVIRVWDAAGCCRQELRGHQGSVLALARLTADTFVSGSRDQQVRIWQRGAAGAFGRSAPLPLHQGAVLALARLADDTFASAGADALVHIVDTQGQVRRTLRGHTDWVWQVVVLSADVLATSSEDGSIRCWHWPSGRELLRLPGLVSVLSLAYDAPRRQLVSGNLHGEIRVYELGADFTTATLRACWAAHRGLVRTLLPLPGGRLASGGEDSCVRVWDPATGRAPAEHPHQNFVQALALDAAGQLLSASYDGSIRRWPLPEAAPAAPPPGC